MRRYQTTNILTLLLFTYDPSKHSQLPCGVSLDQRLIALHLVEDEGKASMVREMNNERTEEAEAEVKQNVSVVLEGNQGRPDLFSSSLFLFALSG